MNDAGAYIFRPGEAELRWMGETLTRFLATGEQTGRTFCLVDEQAHAVRASHCTGTPTTSSRSTCWRAS